MTPHQTMIEDHLRELTAALYGFAASADLDEWGSELAQTLPGRGGRLFTAGNGGSPNVLRATETAPEYGAQVWSITGRHRNPLSSRSKQFLAVDSDDGQIVQEVHQVAIHLLCACLDGALRTPGRHRPGSRS